jgi:FMN phosphatase YigB (HAD superfamily)
MEKVFIFDLDNTLYQQPSNVHNMSMNTFYNSLPRDLELRKLLLSLKNIYVFTNGNGRHLENCINYMGLRGCFKDATYRDLFKNKLKPSLNPYILSYYRFNLIHKNVFFFEDTLANLRTGKIMGWITVYINKILPEHKPYYIDYMFTNIKSAINSIKL